MNKRKQTELYLSEASVVLEMRPIEQSCLADDSEVQNLVSDGHADAGFFRGLTMAHENAVRQVLDGEMALWADLHPRAAVLVRFHASATKENYLSGYLV